MKGWLLAAASAAIMLQLTAPARAQSDPDPALNNPDKLAWDLFIKVNNRAGGENSVFETYASDSDTFIPQPKYPTGTALAGLHPSVLPAVARQIALENGEVEPALPPGAAQGQLEESRRNRVAFDFIVDNDLYKVSGLRAHFGQTLSFPVDSIELKANWIPVAQIGGATNNQVTPQDAPKYFHINTDPNGVKYALLSMHVISKNVPNWTWATFESRFNSGRCDIIGCHDHFGAQKADVPPASAEGGPYPDCVKTEALKAKFAGADIDPVYLNYCLKGSQIDFTDNTGLDVRLGDSVTERTFVDTSSCMTCHSRAAFDSTGRGRPGAGFLSSGAGPLGPILPAWFWKFAAKPPILQGMSGLQRLWTSADFVWSIPFCVVDDTVNPPKLSDSCFGK